MSTSTLTVAVATVSVYAFTIAVTIATVTVNVDSKGCNCNRNCTLSTLSGARVDNICIINAYCSQCGILFLDITSFQCYSVWSKIRYAYRWKGDQMFYLLAKVSFAYLFPVSLKSLCFSFLSTRRQFRSVLLCSK